jgi:mannose-6-phosphate isomerase-like protein (cupin superfamily)
MFRLALRDTLRTLADGKTDFARLLEKPQFDVSLYKPDRIDPQGPHARDELYVVAAGAGFFRQNGEREPVTTGDVLFVEAGVEHRFEDFSDDFAAWVVFFGPRPHRED